MAALRGIRAHLGPGGTAMVPLFVPEPAPADQVGEARTATSSWDLARTAGLVVRSIEDLRGRPATAGADEFTAYLQAAGR